MKNEPALCPPGWFWRRQDIGSAARAGLRFESLKCALRTILPSVLSFELRYESWREAGVAVVIRLVFGLKISASSRACLISIPRAPALPRTAPPTVPGMPLSGVRFGKPCFSALIIARARGVPASAVSRFLVIVVVFAVSLIISPRKPLSWNRILEPPPIIR